MTLLTNIYNVDTLCFHRGYITFDGGVVTSVSDSFSGEYEDCSALFAAPGFVDIHTHGAAGVDLSDPVGIDFDKLSDYYLSHGVTTYLPSTTSCPHADLMATIKAVREAMAETADKAAARIAGIHIEGPYINPVRAGAHDLSRIRNPQLSEIEEIIAATGVCCGHMAVYMTIAPELENSLESIRRMTAAGARITLGHTDGTTDQIKAGLSAGAVNFTHTFNAMTPLHHRSAGPIGMALSYGGFAEMIVDGVHVCPEVVKLTYLAKGSRNLVVVSDSMQAAGMAEGEYILGGVTVNVKNGQALIGSTLAGSVTNLHDELKNLMSFAGISLAEALPCVSANPARAAGLYRSVGSLEEGKSADVVLLNGKNDIERVFVRGIARA